MCACEGGADRPEAFALNVAVRFPSRLAGLQAPHSGIGPDDAQRPAARRAHSRAHAGVGRGGAAQPHRSCRCGGLAHAHVQNGRVRARLPRLTRRRGLVPRCRDRRLATGQRVGGRLRSPTSSAVVVDERELRSALPFLIYQDPALHILPVTLEVSAAGPGPAAQVLAHPTFLRSATTCSPLKCASSARASRICSARSRRAGCSRR